MIGQPTNFQHTGHIGSGDPAGGGGINSVQMQGKGGHVDQDSTVVGATSALATAVPIGQADNLAEDSFRESQDPQPDS